MNKMNEREAVYVVQRKNNGKTEEYQKRDDTYNIIHWCEVGLGRMFDSYAAATHAAQILGGYVKKIHVERFYDCGAIKDEKRTN